MMHKIKQFFDNHLSPISSDMARDPQHALQLAVAVLLYEVAESDYQQHPEEKAALLEAVKSIFNLGDAESSELLAMAEAEHADSTDYFQFTRLINEHYSADQKVDLVEKLWLIAFSDRELHHYEEHVIRRLAELLYVPHSAFIAAKHKVQQIC
ncbi:tellurite resistance TerB family protein [Sedimenticola selenatireducens]|uniref:TerB family tellurite resistance protein n=1 Tax=Sedimenticola selenatireducens TaxID=191960 RepID=A0A558DVR4_9GAMM|nr:TerB family tellurite resistance protein [Sedimenticola selenatireducens]TVO77830.1 TerB family tellurite resistance protein [Sedimenticola selenatireducens]TVT65135.1 MAG: TerB family tellurite resistance protein [Sedimenticola selenatireducens]